MAAFHSTGASKRLRVVTLRIRRYTCNKQMGMVTRAPEGEACSPHVSVRSFCSSWGHTCWECAPTECQGVHCWPEAQAPLQRGEVWPQALPQVRGHLQWKSWDSAIDGKLWSVLTGFGVAARFLCWPEGEPYRAPHTSEGLSLHPSRPQGVALHQVQKCLIHSLEMSLQHSYYAPVTATSSYWTTDAQQASLCISGSFDCGFKAHHRNYRSYNYNYCKR